MSALSSWDLVHGFLVLSSQMQLGAAAEQLGVSSRTLSRRIARLEADLETTLIVRSTRSVALTRAGETLRTHALLVQESMEHATAAVAREGRTRPMLVGISPDVPGDWLARVESWIFRRDTPATLERRALEDAVPLVRAGALDLLLALGDFAAEDRSVVVGREPLLAVFPETHPAARQSAVRVGDLRDLPVAVSDIGRPVHHRRSVELLHGTPDLPYIVAARVGTIAPGLVRTARTRHAAALVLAGALDRVDTDGLAVRPMDPPQTVPVTLLGRPGATDGLLDALAGRLLREPVDTPPRTTAGRGIGREALDR